MSEYFAHHKHHNTYHQIHVKQILQAIIVKEPGTRAQWYFNLDSFLDDWDELERHTYDKEGILAGGVVCT